MNWNRICAFALALNLAVIAVTKADENVRAAQTRLKDAGFFVGEADGKYDSATATAITRYQIRHGLTITGKLDAATAKALGVQPNEQPAAPDAETWRQLRQSDEQFLERLNSGKIPAPRTTPPPPQAAPSMTSIPIQTSKQPMIEPHGPPPPAPENPPPAPPTSAPAIHAKPAGAPFGRERIRDYIAAFVLAGLDRHVGAELEFFAPRVDYFGERKVSRETIRRDLVRYDQRWTERQFSLAGDLVIQPLTTDRVEVTFPLRYELHGPGGHASGVVNKSLTLQRTPADEWEIVAVNERKP